MREKCRPSPVPVHGPAKNAAPEELGVADSVHFDHGARGRDEREGGSSFREAAATKSLDTCSSSASDYSTASCGSCARHSKEERC
jgi:hypothetical protein